MIKRSIKKRTAQQELSLILTPITVKLYSRVAKSYNRNRGFREIGTKTVRSPQINQFANAMNKTLAKESPRLVEFEEDILLKNKKKSAKEEEKKYNPTPRIHQDYSSFFKSISRNKYSRVMVRRPMSPGVGWYRPKYESVIPSPKNFIIRDLKLHSPSPKKQRRRLCKRFARHLKSPRHVR
ncbi:unnamed protein product [Moneuplotes crassus]|uniref:Uncharacterized protein n=1 Tax=Euplotes crassus TaxID=5936 RepID=A0AAD1XF48_EUPCR|nr:unnamed protein product [Moneuplotes crassus]